MVDKITPRMEHMARMLHNVGQNNPKGAGGIEQDCCTNGGQNNPKMLTSAGKKY